MYKFICANITKSRNFTNSYKKLAQNKKIHLDGSNSKAASDKDGLEEKWEEGQDPNEEEIGLNPSPARPSTSPAPAGRFSFAPTIRNIKSTTSSPSLKAKSHARFPTGNFYSAGSPSTSISKKYYHVYNITQVPTTLKRFSSSAAFGNFENCDETNENYKKAMEDLYKIQSKKPAFQWKVVNSGKPSYIPNEIWAKRDKKKSSLEITYPTHTVKHNLMLGQRFRIKEGSASKKMIKLEGNFKQKKHFIPKTLKKRIYSRKITYPTMPENSKTKRRINVVTMTQCHSNAGEIEESGVPLIKVVKSVREQGGMSLKYFSDAQSARSIPPKQPKPIDSIEKDFESLIRSHPTIQNASKEVKMKLKNRFIQLLLKSSPEPDAAAVSENKATAEEVPAEDNDKNIVEEDGKKLADNKEFKEEEGHVQEADKQVAMNDEQIKYHPSSVYTENPQQNDYSAIKYTKRVFTDSVNNFDINDVCIKDPNNKSGSVFVQPGIGIEEPKLNYKNLQKEAEKLSTFVSLQSLKKTCADSVKENKKKNKMASHNTETKLEQLKKERQKLLDELEKVSKIKNEEEAKIKNAKLKEEVKRKNHEARVENEMALDEVRANKDQTKAQRLTECMKNQIVNDDLAAAMAKNKDIKDEIAKVKKNFSSLKRDQRVQKTKQIQETATEVETINKMTGNAELEKTSQKVEDKVKPYIKTTEELDKSEEIRSISRSEGRKEPFRKVSLKEERERNNKYDIDRQDKEKSVRPRQLKLKRLPKLFATSDIPRESKKAKGPDNSKMSTTPSDFETTYQSLDEPDETVKHLNEIAQRTKAAAVKRKLKQEERRLYEEKIQKQNSLPSLKSNHSEPRLDKMADLLKEKVQIAEKSKEKIKQLSVEIPQKTNRPTARRGKRSSPGKLDSNVYQVNTFDEVTKYDKLNQMAHDLSLKIRKKKKEEDTSKPRGNKTGTLLNQGSSAENKQPDEPKNNQKKDDFEDPNKLPEQTLSPSEGQPLKRNKGLGHVKEEKEKAKSEKLKTQNVEKHRKIGGIKDHPAVYCIKPEVGKTTACGINDQLPCINKEPEIAFIKPVTPGKETGLSLTVKTSELANVDKDNNITIEDVRQARNLNQAVDSVKSLKVDLQPAQEALSETFVLDLYKDNVFKDYSVVNNYKEQVVSKYFDEKLPGNRQQLYFPKPSLVISDVPETQDSTGLIQDKNADIFENSRNRPREKIEIKTNGQHDTLTDNSDLLKPQASKNLNEFFPKSKKGGFMEIINNHLETKQNHLNVENDHVEVKANDSEMKDTNFNQQIKDKTAEMDADLCLSVDRALEEVIQLDEMLEKIKDFERMLVRQKRVKISGARLENKPRVPPMQKPPTDKKDKKEKPKGPNDMVLPPKARRANPPVPESVPKGHRPEEENVKPTKKATNTKKSPILTDNHFAKKGKFEAHQKVADQNAQEVILQPYNRNKPPPDTPNLEQAISDFIREEKLDEVYDKRDNVKPESSKNVPRETDSKTDKNNDEKFGTDANLASEVTVSDPNFKKKEAGNHFSEGFAMIEPITMVAPRARSLSPVKSNLGKETSLGYKEKFPVLIKPSDGALRKQDPSSSKNALQIQKNISNRGGITMNNITMRGPVVKSVTVIRERFENGRAATFGPKEARIPASAKNNLRGKTVPSRPVSCPPLSAQIRKSKNIDTRAVLVENKAGGRAASCPPKSSSDGIQDSNANNSNWLMKSEQQRAVSVPSRAQSLKAVVKISKPNTAVVKKPSQKESIAVVASVSSRLFTCPPAVIQRRRTNKNEEKQIVNKSDYKNSIGPPTKPSARGRPSIVNFVKPRPISCPPTTALIKKLGKPGRHVRGTDDNSAFRTASCPPKSSTSGLQEQTKYFNLSSQPASQQSMRTSKSAQKLQESKTKFSSWSSNSIPPKNPDTPLAEVKTGSTEKKDSVKRETTRSSSLPAPSKNPDFSTAGTPAGSGAPKGKKVYMSRLSKEELGKKDGLRNAKSNLDSKDNVLKKSQSETGLKSEPSVDTITNKLSKKTTDVFKTVINSSKGNRQEDIQKKSQSKDEVVMKHDFLKPNSSDAKNINTKMKSMPKVLTKKAESTDNNLELKWTFPESTKTESLIGDMKPTVHSNGSKKNLPQTGKIEITKVEGNVYININSKLPGNENITDKIATKPNTGTTVKKQLDENIENPKAKSNILFKKKQEHPTSSAQSLETTKLYNIYINDEMTRSTPQIVKKSNLKIPDEKREETEGKENIIESEKLDVSKNKTKYGEAPSELHLRTNLFNICINKTSNENISVPKKEKPELPLNNLNTIVGNNLETKARQDRIDQSSDPVKFSYPSVYKREKKELLPQNTSKEYVQINNIYVKKSFRSILESGYHISNPPFSNIFETTTIKLLDNKNKLKKSNSSSKTTLQDALKKNQDTDNLDMDYLPLKKVVLSVNVDTVNVEEIYQTKQLKNRIKDDLENADITKFPPHTSFVEFTEDEDLSKKKNSSGDVAKGKKKGTNQPSKNPDSTKPGKNLHEKELTDILKPGILTVFTKEKLESSPSKELADFTKVGNMFIRNSDHKLEQSLQRNDMYTLNIPKLEDGVAKKKSNAAEKVLSDINYSNNSFKSSSMYILNIPSVLDKTNIPQVSPKQEVKPTKSDNLANKTFDDFFTSNAKKNVNGNSKKSLHLKDVPKNELKDSIYSYRKSFGQNKPLEVKKTISTDLNSPNLTDGQKNDLKSAKSDKLPTTPFIVNKRVLDTKKPGETELEMNAKNIEKETPPTNSTKFSDIGKERANVANTDTKDKQESENDKLRYKCVEVSSRFELDEVFGERQNLFKTLKSKSIKDISNKSDSMQEQDIMDQQKIDLELKSKTTNQNTPQIDESKPRGKLLFRSKSVQEKLREENDGVSSDLKGSTTYFEPSETSGQPKDQGNKLIEDKQDLKLNSEATNPNTKNVFESVATKVENDDWLKRKLLMNKNKDERQKSPNSESMPKIVSNLKDINETIRKIIISKIEDVTKEITKKTVEDEELGKNKQLKPSKTNDPMSKKIGEAKYDTKLMETTSKKDDQKETLDNLKKPIRSETVKENIKNAADKLVKCGIMDEKCLSTQKIVMNPKSDSKLNNVVLEESNVKDQLLEPIETKPQTDSQDVYETEPDAGKHVKAISKPYLSFLGKLDQEDQIKRREKFKKRMNSCKRVGQVIKRKEREKINEIQEMNSAAQHILKRKEEQEWDEMFRGGKRQRLYEKETKMSRPSSGTAPWGVKVKDSELLEPPGKKDDTKNVHNSTNVPPSGENPSKKGGPKLMSRAEFYKLQRKINPSKTKNSDKEKMAVKLATNKQESKKDIQESFDKNQLSETKLLDNAQELKNLKQSASDSDFSITKKTSLTSEIMTFKINKMAKLLVDDLTNNKSKEKFIKGNLEELSEVENYPFIKSKKVAKGSLNNKKKDDKNLPPSGLSQNTGSQKNAGKSIKTTKDTTEMKKTNGNSNVQIRKGDGAPLQEKGKTNLGPAKQEKSNKKLNETNMKSQSLQEAVDLSNKRSEDISKYFNIFQGVIQQPDIPSKKEDKTPIKSDVQKITMNLKSGEIKQETTRNGYQVSISPRRNRLK